ncbi:MAG: porin family protein [Chitinophagales bacterium]|nr:porin family protein [Chitinophagales bacterium]
MRNQLFFFAFILSITSIGNIASAQSMEQGQSIAQIGIGIGGWTTTYTSSQTPLFIATYETGIVNDLGPGNLSIGGTVAFKSGTYSYWNDNWGYNYTALAVRANYHPDFIQAENWDFYGGLSLGYYRVAVNTNRVDLNGIDFASSGIALAGQIGARYQFHDNFGAWAELGYGLGALNVGLSYKF